MVIGPVLYGAGAISVEGRIQLLAHPVSRSDLTVFIILVTGVILRIRLECILEITHGRPSAAKPNDAAQLTLPVDILPLAGIIAKARLFVFAELRAKTLRGDIVLVFEPTVGASISVVFRGALDTQDDRWFPSSGNALLSTKEVEREAADDVLLALDQLLSVAAQYC